MNALIIIVQENVKPFLAINYSIDVAKDRYSLVYQLKYVSCKCIRNNITAISIKLPLNDMQVASVYIKIY